MASSSRENTIMMKSHHVNGGDDVNSINKGTTSKSRVNITLLLGRGSRGEILALFISFLALFSLLNSRKLNLHVYLHDGYAYSVANVQSNRSDLASESIEQQIYQQHNVNPSRKSRVLAGIFSADMMGETRYRSAFRDLLRTHPKVCSFADYVSKSSVREGPCEFIYTFVLGGNLDENAPTEIVSNKTDVEIIAPTTPRSWYSSDFHENDITFLNIK